MPKSGVEALCGWDLLSDEFYYRIIYAVLLGTLDSFSIYRSFSWAAQMPQKGDQVYVV